MADTSGLAGIEKHGDESDALVTETPGKSVQREMGNTRREVLVRKAPSHFLHET